MSVELGKIIKAAREAKGLDQVQLGARFGISKSAVNLWESGRNAPDFKKHRRLSEILELDLEMIAALASGEPWPKELQQTSFLPPAPATRRAPPPAPPPPETIDVWASAEGGDHGAMLIASDPIDRIPRPPGMARDAFAVFLLGDSMSPAYEQGDQLYVDPNKPIRPGNDCLFVREAEDGSRYALAKRLVRPTADKWHVRQFTPAKDFTLSRAVWSRAWLIAGKWNR